MRFHELKCSLTRTVEPTEWPVTLDEAKDELDILDDASRDDRVMRLIRTATDVVETDAQIAILPQTWQLKLDRFPCDGIEVRLVPVGSVTSVKHLVNGVLTTWGAGNYDLDLVGKPARIHPVLGVTYPISDIALNAIVVEFDAGYDTPADVPSMVKDAVLYVVRQMYHGCELGDAYRAMIQRISWAGYQ
jgi:uncharacterized phiE125 gp8 family phage protein